MSGDWVERWIGLAHKVHVHARWRNLFGKGRVASNQVVVIDRCDARMGAVGQVLLQRNADPRAVYQVFFFIFQRARTIRGHDDKRVEIAGAQALHQMAAHIRVEPRLRRGVEVLPPH